MGREGGGLKILMRMGEGGVMKTYIHVMDHNPPSTLLHSYETLNSLQCVLHR